MTIRAEDAVRLAPSPSAEVPAERQWRSPRFETVRLFMRSPVATVSVVVLAIIVLVCAVAPLLGLANPNEVNAAIKLQPIGSPGHILGTDSIGRDVLSRLVWGGRVSLLAGVFAATISAVPGIIAGLVAGFYGRAVDGILMRLIDIIMAFPPIVLALAIVTMIGPGLFNAMLAVGVVGTPLYARLVRASVLSIKEREFVEAARAQGTRTGRIILRHILPNVWAPVIVAASLDVGAKIIATSALSFLGLGSQPPDADWGDMLASGRDVLTQGPHVATLPGIAIFIVVLALNLVGDGLRDALDPQLRS